MILQICCTLVNLTMKVDQGSGTCLAQGAMKP